MRDFLDASLLIGPCSTHNPRLLGLTEQNLKPRNCLRVASPITTSARAQLMNCLHLLLLRQFCAESKLLYMHCEIDLDKEKWAETTDNYVLARAVGRASGPISSSVSTFCELLGRQC